MFISNQPSIRIAILCSYCTVDMSIFSNRLGAPQSQELVPGLVWSLAQCPNYDLLQLIFQVVLLPDNFLKYWFHYVSFLIKTTIYTLSLTCGSRYKSACCMASFLSSLLSSYPFGLVALFSGPSDTSTNLYLSLPLPLSYHFLCHLTTCQIVTCVVLLSQLATDGRDSILPLWYSSLLYLG